MDDYPPTEKKLFSSRDLVAVILAFGIVLALNFLTFGALYSAVRGSGVENGLSENATQILTTVFSGIIGVLGSYIGYKTGYAEASKDMRTEERRGEHVA
jgi:hypothetical protein